ncbi:hypothetical protein KY285_010350 [Solanum tuberosum]|nr:hypothetical protein KY284_011988 [Solanum tuberosum]KAH0734643.1 hypothetical protein KY285_010350 [Solanum tuberosum]
MGTKVNKTKLQQLCDNLGFEGLSVVDPEGQWWLSPFMEREGHVHIVWIPDFQYTGFYGCPETNRRRHSWEILKSLKNKSLLPWCVAGYFNDILSYGDKMGRIQQPTWRLDGFRRAVNFCELQDLGYVGNKFTWERGRGMDLWVSERLDRALATTSWRVLFNRATVYHMETACSDHMALFISLGISIILYSPVKFHFENSWLRETDVKEAVEEGWNRG